MTKEQENIIKSLIEKEKTFNEIFREFGLKPAQSQLIRAFLIVSEGKVEFEASNLDLAKVLYKSDGQDYQKLYDKVRYDLKTLKEWQVENELTLIRVKKKGRRDKGADGKFLYSKTKYEFVLLTELTKAINKNPENIESVIKEIIARLKEQFVPVEKSKAYHPRHLMRKAKNTIFTKLRKVFQLAIQANDNPVSYCQGILNDGWEILNGLETEYTANQNRDKFIREFESQLNTELLEDSNELDSNI